MLQNARPAVPFDTERASGDTPETTGQTALGAVVVYRDSGGNVTEHLIPPYGGTLMNLTSDPDRATELRAKSRDWPSWVLLPEQLADVELLANGGLSPLTGFMTRRDWQSVCEQERLSDGTYWPAPIVLQVSAQTANPAQKTGWIALRDAEGVMVAALELHEIWQPDAQLAGLTGLQAERETVCAAGSVWATTDYFHYDFRPLRLGPSEVRQMFDRLGWRRVLAFPCAGPIHRAEHASMLQVARSHKVNLLIQALVGSPQADDRTHYTTVRALRAAMERFPRNTTRLTLVSLAPRRLLGERRWIGLEAIIARNFGCTHLAWTDGLTLNGRCGDTAPLPDELETIRRSVGVDPVPAGPMVWVEDEAAFRPAGEIDPTLRTRTLSPAEVQQRLDEDRPLPVWFTFDDVASELRRSHRPRHSQGFTVFFTGLSGAGKSTVANVLRVKLMELGDRPVTLLDGDIVRRHLSSELGFSREHRNINIQRIGFVASEITKNGGIAICAPIAPYDSVRREVRSMVQRGGGFILVHVATPLEICERRDRKGLYAKARAGLIPEFTGVSDPYEPPTDADIVLDTSELSPAQATQVILLHLAQKGYMGTPDEG